MKTITFFVDCKPVSWNSIATSHWRKYQGYKADMIQATWAAIKSMDNQHLTGPIEITIDAHWPTKRKTDVDNIFAKSIIDTLVREQIIEADDFTVVKRVTLTGSGSHKRAGIEVTIKEV